MAPRLTDSFKLILLSALLLMPTWIRMWLDGVTADHTKERLSENRVKEAIEIGAEVLVVCCPYEVSRFEDAVKSTNNEGKLEVLDIAEILDFCMEGD